MILLTLILGLIILSVGSEVLIKYAVITAKHLGISKLAIGVILIGFGTSMPELITCIEAALKGAPDIATGNIVGSNIANILLILGVTALICPFKAYSQFFIRDAGMLFGSACVMIALILYPHIHFKTGMLLLSILAFYTYYTFKTEKIAHPEEDLSEHKWPVRKLFAPVLLSFLGIGLTIVGAKILVAAAIDIARLFGISEAIIGLTMIAFGTSVPELATAISGARKKESNLIYGNIIGSNIYNVFGILGATALVSPLSLPAQLIHFDIWVMAFVTTILVLMAARRFILSRFIGGLFLIGYCSYIGYLYLFA